MNTVTHSISAAIILYGHSLLLDSIELTLRKNGRLPILRLSNPPAPPLLKNVPTGMIIYDQNCANPTAVYQLLIDYPGWRLVGLTTAKESLLIINSEKGNGSSLADVIDFIEPYKRR